MKKFNIFLVDREYAKEKGNPVLGVISARNKKEALKKAERLGLNKGYFGKMMAIDKDWYDRVKNTSLLEKKNETV